MFYRATLSDISENLQQIWLWLEKNWFKSSRLRCSLKYFFQKIDSFQGIHLLHFLFIMKQQVIICLFIKTEFYEFDSAVLKNLQRLQFYQKALKKTSVKMQTHVTCSKQLIASIVIFKLVVSIVHVWYFRSLFGTIVNVNRKLAVNVNCKKPKKLT